jgi:putative tricarboxylic transport membrane protein
MFLMTRWIGSAGIGAVLAVALGAGVHAAPAELSIMAPAGPGGGWDQTARSMQQVLQEAGIVPNVQVTNVPGAGGTIGLAQFVNTAKGDPTHLIVGGYVMVGAIIANNSPVSLADVTPIARLTGEYEAIVVPASSPIQSMEDLVAELKKDPGAVSWAGGSAGGVDHIAVGLIAKAAGVDPTKINYIPFSGGGEALAAILGAQVTAGVSGYGEFAGQIESGDLRLLGISAPGPVEGIDARTLKDAGLDVDVQNWRMVAAGPDLTDEQKADLVATVEAMAETDQWKETLATKGWLNTFLAGDDFAAYIDGQIEDTGQVLKDIGVVQ